VEGAFMNKRAMPDYFSAFKSRCKLRKKYKTLATIMTKCPELVKKKGGYTYVTVL